MQTPPPPTLDWSDFQRSAPDRWFDPNGKLSAPMLRVAPSHFDQWVPHHELDWIDKQGTSLIFDVDHSEVHQT